MWGVGPKTAPRMRALGYETLGDLAHAEAGALERAFGSWGLHARALARGDDARDVDPHHAAISIGAEQTYEEDLRGTTEVARTLLEHASHVARRLLRANLCAYTVALKVKYSDFTIRSRRLTLDHPVQDTDALHEAALKLLERIPLENRRVRLTGVSVSGICSGPPPRVLLPDAKSEKRRRVEEVAARIGERFHDERAVTRATLLEKRSERK
jgi:DNA polymerase-4